jgi:hypothetical protein
VAGLAGIYTEVLWFQELHRDIAEGHHHARVRARTFGRSCPQRHPRGQRLNAGAKVTSACLLPV